MWILMRRSVVVLAWLSACLICLCSLPTWPFEYISRVEAAPQTINKNEQTVRKVQTDGANGAVGQNSAIQKQLVKVVITTSRPEVTRAHAWGLTADITNVSDRPIAIYEKEVQLVMEPEATRSSTSTAYDSFLPNMSNSDGKSTESDSMITLQPGEHYIFFWDGQESNLARQSNEPMWQSLKFDWQQFQESLNFVPGSYAFVVEGKVHVLDSVGSPSSDANARKTADQEQVATTPLTSDSSADDYHTFAEAVSVKISIPQLAILLWAGFGAILGYLVVSLDGNGELSQVWTADSPTAQLFASLRFGRKICSAFLTGSILSIVANRLSDTQFPVKVSVNDVWGSITVGFVFFFVGSNMINRLKTLVPTTPTPTTPTPATPTPTTPTPATPTPTTPTP